MKSLLLRLDVTQYSQEQLDAINQMFSTYYSSVTFLDIEEQRRKLQDLILNTDCKVLSMDKFIPLEYNIDVSRVFDIDGNYLYHRIMYNGKQLRDVPVIIYDHDMVGGHGLKLAKSILTANNCQTTHFVFVELTKEQAKTKEILDLADFFDSGMVCEIEPGVVKRVPYFINSNVLEKRASIPSLSYARFCEDLDGLKSFLQPEV